MATLGANLYCFDGRQTANWTTTQEKSISQDYPFLLQEENPEDYIARTYLQFLWLPDSVMPLHLLVPSLRRANVPSTSNPDASIHSMHKILEPLLLKTRSLSNKYRVELPQILADGGGAGEMEETMMWYSLTHEKGEEGKEHTEDIWTDDTWRENYLERMEQREVKIQIILYFYKLSLPGPPPPIKISKKKRAYRSREPEEPVLTPEDDVESFMDKLSMWQLVGNLDRSMPRSTVTKKGDDRDWIQIFVEDLVERQFKTQLPDLCSLLHSKTFPTSPFSDNQTESHRISPEPRKPVSRIPSPTFSSASQAPSKLSARARSRSISVSLAQEQAERDRASAVPSKKRFLNREVSMSRMFKPKPKRPVAVSMAVKTEGPQPLKIVKKDTDIILVEETPQKPRVAPIRTMSIGQQLLSTAAVKPSSMVHSIEDNDEEWMIQSSPDIVTLNTPKRGSSASSGLMDIDSDGEDEQSVGQVTPCKPSGKRRR